MAFSQLIVNADDFGYSEAVNRAIVNAFQFALLTSTSIMANMPGFDQAVELVHQHSPLQHKIGVHLNLTEETPLSPEILSCSRLCGKEGRFSYDRYRDGALFRLSRRERGAVHAELRMQLERVLTAGIRPLHLDSHHHVHTEWAIAPLVGELARTYGIRRIRLARNIGPASGRARQAYKKLFNYWFLRRRHGLYYLSYEGI